MRPLLGDPSVRQPVRLLLLALALAMLATLTAPQPIAQARIDPSKDHPRLPPRCEGDLHIIPTTPGACFVTEFRKNRPTVVLWGDSHAWQYVPAVQAAARARKANLVGFFMGGCPPVKVALKEPTDGYKSICEKHNAMAMKFVKRLEKGPQDVRVLLGASWAGYRRADREIRGGAGEAYYGYTAWVKQMVRLFMRGAAPLFPALGKVGVDVDVIGQTATVPRRPAACPTGEEPYTCAIPRKQAIYDEAKTRTWLRGLMKKLAGRPRLIEVNNAFCGPTRCHGMVDGIYTFYDDLHLSATNVRTLRPFFRQTFRALR
ncbi:MAG: SGNH hydrolase domain-containing protein [Nocardioides sp.]|nr:SGNH hydrolase domain-containing protein [Nocardioides sp.]